MSEQPSQASSAPPRPRRLLDRFRDLPIWSKLGVIMIVPTLATIVVGTNGLLGHLDTYNAADRTGVLANLAVDSGALVHHLQDERAAAVMLLGADGEEQQDQRQTAYAQVQDRANEAQQAYQDRRTRLTGLQPQFRSLLNDVDGRLVDLPQLRNRISGGELGVSDATHSYEELINGLINLRGSSAQLSGESELGDRMRAAAGIARAKEYLSRQRVVGHEVLIREAYHPQQRTAFIGSQTGQTQALEQFSAVATDEERTMLEQTLDGSDVRQSTIYRDYLESLATEDLGNPPWDAESWDTVMSAHANLLREIEAGLDGQVVDDAVGLRNAVTQRMLVETGALIAVLLGAVLLAWLVARTMARSLRELRQGALAVAQYGLPQAVARLRDPSLSTKLSPAQVASQIAEPLPVRSRDEFGQVTEAFNAVHLEAVRTAAEQASLRSSVSTMFVNLARRSQILVDRLIGHLDRLERGEEDPDRLAELFQLDHLATRMRRNDENLLVLAGADSSRVQREPASLIDVLRAAQSEVEHYTRIEFGTIDRDIEVTAQAVNDLVHLVAELLDNATAFSPPDSQVTVEARRVGDRVVLYVEDQGLGLSAEQLVEVNDRLATPPQVDVAVSRMMGLVVVSRLAARHGVQVELRRGAQRGTVADVTLPAQALVPRGSTGQQPAVPPTVQPPAELPPRVPLALESEHLEDGQTSISGPPISGPPISGPPISGLPVRRPSSEPSGAPVSGVPERAGRRLPVWSDLTGASGHNGTEPAASPPGGALPQRRPGATREASGDDGPLIPRQRPADQLPVPAEPAAGEEATQAGAPPPWPLAASGSTPAERPQPTEQAQRMEPAQAQAARPVEPVEPAAPVEPVRPAERASPAAPYAPPEPQPVDAADATMELPIFTQLESAWFRAGHRSAPASPAEEPDGAGSSEFAAVGATASTTGDAMGDATRGPTLEGRSAESTGQEMGPDWRTAADEGWRAAASLNETAVDETTEAGLPKRRPMAQLVPGGVDTGETTPQRRSPEAVRGLLSAYHRGVQRGRTQSSTDDVTHSAQAGKEQGA